MPDIYKLREVFSRGMPTVTYVGREHLHLEQELRNAMAKGNAIIAITGPSKSGKTVLRRKVIADNVVAHVEGGQITTEDDFWEAVKLHLESPSSTTSIAIKQTSDSSGFTLKAKTPVLEAGVDTSEGRNSTRQETRTFNGPQKGGLLNSLKNANDVLVVDDFHYIEKATRATIVRSLKSAVFDGLPVVMLSVPYRAFDVLAAETEMEGRFTHLSIPSWNKDDLLKIARQGFPCMNMIVHEEIEELLAEESLGSPLLMQSLCAQLCIQISVLETAENPLVVDRDEVDLPSLFYKVAQDFGLPAFKKLSSGPSRSDRQPRKFANGQSGDIYEAILAAVAYAGAGEQIAYDDLRSALREILTETLPQKHEVTRSIQYMVEIAKKMQRTNALQREQAEDDGELLVDVPAVDWAEDTLQINDVFLRFYLRWIQRPQLLDVD